MSHPEVKSEVKLIKLEQGFNEYKIYVGKTGEVTRCDRYGDRRFYWVRFMEPKPELMFLYRPEIEVIED
jgi:hypothetical protein